MQITKYIAIVLLVLGCEGIYIKPKSNNLPSTLSNISAPKDLMDSTNITNRKDEKGRSKSGAENKKKISPSDTIASSRFPRLSDANAKEFLIEYGKKNKETIVKISTRYGIIMLELYKKTPLHRANFIYLVKQKYFNETFFYRAAKDFVIQGGNSDREAMAKKRHEIGDYTVPQEQIKGLNHHRGAVALSKQWVDNPSNRSTPFEFFIVIAKQGAPHLDGEHTVFGKVIQGISVADQIANVPVDESEWPKENIFIQAEVIK